MAKDPAFLFYPGDWLGGTMGMTFEEKGAYITLLMLQFNRGHMTSHMIGQTVGQLWDSLKDKFEIDSQGLYYNARLQDEIQKRKAFTESRRNNISGNNQYSKKEEIKTGHMGGHMTSHMEDEDENVIDNKEEVINYNGVLENYHLYCDRLSKVIKLSDARKKHISARFKEFDYETIISVFKKVSESDFLNGKNDRYWKADFDWIFNPNNFLKIYEGKYNNKVKSNIDNLMMP